MKQGIEENKFKKIVALFVAGLMLGIFLIEFLIMLIM